MEQHNQEIGTRRDLVLYCMEQLEKQKENWHERGCPSGFEALRDIFSLRAMGAL